MLPEHIKELVELGNGVGGIKVSGKTKEEIRENIRKAFEKSKKNKESTDKQS